jgi:hypothetical protein
VSVREEGIIQIIIELTKSAVMVNGRSLTKKVMV